MLGAVYDGVTDCTAAIQRCLDRRGEVRLCGAGTAQISKPLRIAANPRQDYLWGSFGFFGCLMQIVNTRRFILRDTRLYDATMYFFEADTVFDLDETVKPDVQHVNTDFVCRKTGLRASEPHATNEKT